MTTTRGLCSLPCEYGYFCENVSSSSSSGVKAMMTAVAASTSQSQQHARCTVCSACACSSAAPHCFTVCDGLPLMSTVMASGSASIAYNDAEQHVKSFAPPSSSVSALTVSLGLTHAEIFLCIELLLLFLSLITWLLLYLAGNRLKKKQQNQSGHQNAVQLDEEGKTVSANHSSNSLHRNKVTPVHRNSSRKKKRLSHTESQ